MCTRALDLAFAQRGVDGAADVVRAAITRATRPSSSRMHTCVAYPKAVWVFTLGHVRAKRGRVVDDDVGGVHPAGELVERVPRIEVGPQLRAPH